MPRQNNKRARSSPKTKSKEGPMIDANDEEVVDVVRNNRRTKSNPVTSNGVKNDSPPPRARRGKRKMEEEPDGFNAEVEVMKNDDDGDGEQEESEVKEKEEMETEEIFECPTCKKRFTSKYGRKYHVDNIMVCQPGSRIKKAKIEKSKSSAFDEEIANTGGRRKASLRAAKKIMSLTTKSRNSSEFDSDDREDEEAATAASTDINSDDEFIAEDGRGVKSDDDLVADEDEDENVIEPKKKGEGRVRRKSERMSYSSCSIGEKFGILEKGSRFITKFGVVEVIADDRAPAFNSENTIAATPQSVRTFLNRRTRFRERHNRVINDIAAGTRYRREELTKMYASCKNSTSAADIPQTKVWNLYCKSLSLKQILIDGFTSTAEKREEVEEFSEEDPRFPAELYPDRIVECKLVEDQRDYIVVAASFTFVSTEDEEEGMTDLEYNVIDRPSTSVQVAPMRLFIARKELTQEYDASIPCYVCKVCNKSARHREGIRYHLSNNLCWVDKNEENEDRMKQIRDIESKATAGTGCSDILLTRLHGIVEDVKRRGEPMFGNPHRIKEHKKHRLPPWLVFNDQRSSMYPEIYVSLGFKRGSQNRNYFKKMKQEDGYVPRPEKTRLKKRLKTILARYQSGSLTTIPAPSNSVNESLVTEKKKKATKKKSEKNAMKAEKIDLPPSLPPFPLIDTSYDLPPALPPLPPIDGTYDMDFSFDYNGTTDDNVYEDTPDSSRFNEVSTPWNNAAVANLDKCGKAHEPSLADCDKNNRRRKQVVINKKKQYHVIDTQVLAAECDSGRYPSINRFHGDHDVQCTICNVSDEVPLIYCDYCKNAVHQTCLDKRMLGKDPQVIIRENEPDDTPMCHVCISTCLFRRYRAESRRLTKWQQELAKAGLGGVPEAANLREEINLKDDNLSDGDLDKPSYEPCPDGGPGGLICCSYCTAAYSRFLSNTAKEMEAQSVSRVGQEVSEILELLEDAKQRLLRATSVSQSNEVRRGLLDINQSAPN